MGNAAGRERLSYAELDARAAALAAALRGRGVAAGDVVGVCLRRSTATITALLAVWRAGAAYLPLDSEHPDDRLAFLIKDSGAVMVVTCSDLAGQHPAAR